MAEVREEQPFTISPWHLYVIANLVVMLLVVVLRYRASISRLLVRTPIEERTEELSRNACEIGLEVPELISEIQQKCLQPEHNTRMTLPPGKGLHLRVQTLERKE